MNVQPLLNEGTARITADETATPDEIVDAISRLAHAYLRLTGALPPPVSFASLGFDKTEVNRMRQKGKGSFASIVKKVRETPPNGGRR